MLHSRTVGRVAARSADPLDPPILIWDPFSAAGEDAFALMKHMRDLYKTLMEGLDHLKAGQFELIQFSVARFA